MRIQKHQFSFGQQLKVIERWLSGKPPSCVLRGIKATSASQVMSWSSVFFAATLSVKLVLSGLAGMK